MATRAAALVWVLAGVLGAGCSEVEPQRAHAQPDEPPAVQPPPPPSTGAVATCFLFAQQETNLTDTQIRDLCLGTPTPTGPAACYVTGVTTLMLTDAQLVVLCRCAVSIEPVQCVDRLQRESYLTDVQVLQLCAPVLAYQLLDNCLPATGT